VSQWRSKFSGSLSSADLSGPDLEATNAGKYSIMSFMW
jgi:hypothetical protein